MPRVADFVFKHLHDTGTRHVFLLTGGGAMFLNDALGHCAGIRYICHHHEQACAMAAEAYARVSGRVGVVSVTTKMPVAKPLMLPLGTVWLYISVLGELPVELE